MFVGSRGSGWRRVFSGCLITIRTLSSKGEGGWGDDVCIATEWLGGNQSAQCKETNVDDDYDDYNQKRIGLEPKEARGGDDSAV